MNILELFLNIEFWEKVYLASKWISITLSVIFIIGIIWLLYKISGFRKKLEVSTAYKEFIKKPEPAEPDKSKGHLPQSSQIEKIANSQWKEIILKAESESEKEWRLAVIEADALVDLVLKRSGYRGETMFERLKNVLPENLPSLNQLWEAHKIRNQIAHSPDFSLQKKEAVRILKIYRQSLRELGFNQPA